MEKNTPPTAVNETLLNCITEVSGDIRLYISDGGLGVVRAHDVGSQIIVSSDAGSTWDVLPGQLALNSTPAVFDPVTGFTRDGVFEIFLALLTFEGVTGGPDRARFPRSRERAWS